MTDHPILFSGPMVRALLDGRKTQTRRVLKPQPDFVFRVPGTDEVVEMHQKLGFKDGLEQRKTVRPPYSIGDRLWVREAHRLTDDGECECVVHEADEKDIQDHIEGIHRIQKQCELSNEWAARHLKKRPSIHMPRWASRLTLTVTDVRVQRLQDISEEDAVSEGIREVSAEWPPCSEDGYEGAPYPSYADYGPDANGCFSGYRASRLSFMKLWDSLNAKRGFGWDANPWVVAYTFTVHQENIDRMGGAA